jgi:hypothetical protein
MTWSTIPAASTTSPRTAAATTPPWSTGRCGPAAATDWSASLPEGGSGYSDKQVYERGSLGGGLGYSEARLRALWDKPPFSVRILRQMRKPSQHEPYFGQDFLQVLLATRQDSPLPQRPGWNTTGRRNPTGRRDAVMARPAG